MMFTILHEDRDKMVEDLVMKRDSRYTREGAGRAVDTYLAMDDFVLEVVNCSELSLQQKESVLKTSLGILVGRLEGFFKPSDVLNFLDALVSHKRQVIGPPTNGYKVH